MGSHDAASEVWIDGQTGEVIAVRLERDAAPGNLVSERLRALHTGRVFGVPYRLSVALIGWSVVLLSASGAWIWWRTRRR
ncbi:MAG: hypothetical protein DI587_20945 [Variovorax paradoxus]|nr:MAG: hypothetical protein DI583_20945 [Variovorax paradoxus]PZQ07224.1 MAG: hypothetical protein DI587_20945 [Variovorax paradoxus]